MVIASLLAPDGVGGGAFSMVTAADIRRAMEVPSWEVQKVVWDPKSMRMRLYEWTGSEWTELFFEPSDWFSAWEPEVLEDLDE